MSAVLYTSPVLDRWCKASGKDWTTYIGHPFVKGLSDGTLPEASFHHYLIQDYIFLVHFTRAWAMAVVKSESLEEIKEAKLSKTQLLLASCEEMLTTIEYNAFFLWDSKNKKKKHKKEYISRCSMIVVESQEQHDSNKEFCEKVIEVTKDSFGNKKKKLRNRRIDLCVQFIEKKVQEEEKEKKLEEEKKKRIDTGRGN